MRVALFDGIQEIHVVNSLDRALIFRGHQTLSTGQLTDGFHYITDDVSRDRVVDAIGQVKEFAPDLVIVFRPSALPRELFAILRDSVPSTTRIACWLSDDPVLMNATYADAVEVYDLLLHCGSEEVLEHYEKRFGRPTGVNFPFWTDSWEFPYVFGRSDVESNVVFIGNVGDKIRRDRYFTLAQLSPEIRVHGKVGSDYFGLDAGYLRSNTEIIGAGATSLIGINIPQNFNDYLDTELWYDELRSLKTFEIPSRLPQYGAMGLPMVSLEPQRSSLPFETVLIAKSVKELTDKVSSLLESPRELEKLSEATNAEFRRHYSAASRVKAIEHLLSSGDEWKSWDIPRRHSWYKEFDGTADDLQIGASSPSPFATTTISNEVASRESLDLTRLSPQRSIRASQPGDKFVFLDKSSALSPAKSARSQLGKQISLVDIRDVTAKCETSKCLEIDMQKLSAIARNQAAHIFTEGERIYPPKQRTEIGIKHAYSFSVVGASIDSESGIPLPLLNRADEVYTTNFDLSLNNNAARDSHSASVAFEPDLVNFRVVEKILSKPILPEVTAFIRRESHVSMYTTFLPSVGGQAIEPFIYEDLLKGKTSRSALRELITNCRSIIKFSFPDPSRSGPGLSPLLGYQLAGGGINVFFSAFNLPPFLESGENCIIAEDRQDASLKIKRVLGDADWTAAISSRAQLLFSEIFS